MTEPIVLVRPMAPQRVATVVTLAGPPGPQGVQGPQGIAGVIAATAPITYDPVTQTVGIDTSTFAMLGSPNTFTQPQNVTVGTDVVALIVKGSVAQTADMTQWQDSAGVVKARVYSSGGAQFNTLNLGSSTGKLGIATSVDPGVWIKLTSDLTRGMIIQRNSVTHTADLIQIQSETGTVFSSFGSAGDLLLRTTTQFNSAALSVQPGSASLIGAVVRGRVTQTGDLQQWQDSTGAALAQMQSGGTLRVPVITAVPSAKAFITMSGDTGGVLLSTNADTNKGLVIRRNSPTQSANLLEIQNEAGVSIGFMSPAGSMGVRTGGILSNAMFSVLSAGATNPGIVARAAAAQSANLQEWQDSAAAVLARVDSTGAVISGSWLRGLGLTAANGTGAVFRTNYDTGGLGVTTGADTNKGLVIRRNSATQSANLWEIQKEDGSILTVIKSGGDFSVQDGGGNERFGVLAASGVVTFNANGGTTTVAGGGSTARFNIGTLSATSIGLAVRGVAAQSADYLQIQDSVGGIRGQFDTNAYWRGSGLGSTVGAKTLLLTNYDTGAIGIATQADANKGLVIRRFSATQSANLFEIQDEAGVLLMKHDALLGIAMGGALTLSSASNTPGANAKLFVSSSSSVNILVQPTTATAIPMVVKGAASQTADLQQWQDSAAVVLARILGAGGYRGPSIGDVGSAGPYLSLNTASMDINTRNDANKGLVIRRNSATQSANLWEIQDEGSGILARVLSDGRMTIRSGVLGTASLSVAPTGSANLGLAVRGAASQSGNLTEWQDSAGVVLASVDAVGFFRAAVATGGLAPIGGGKSFVTWASTDGAVHVHTNGVTNIGLIVRATTAQTANLQEWQDSAAGVISKIGPTGWFMLDMNASGNSAIGRSTGVSGVRLVVDAGVATTIPLALRGVVTQTANLQEWQDSAGTVMARVDNIGFVRSGGFASSTGGKAFVSTNGDTGGLLVQTAADANKGLIVRRNSATQTANVFEIQDDTGVVRFLITGDGTFQQTAAAANKSNAIGGVGMAGVNLALYSGAAASVPFAARGAVSQSGDLTQWQDSSGALIALVTAFGTLKGTSVMAGSTAASAGNTSLWAIGRIATAPTAIVQAMAAQTGDIVQWLDSTGAVLGVINTSGGIGTGNRLTVGTNSVSTLARTTIFESQATIIPLLIKAAAAQTADLQQWQDSAAAVKAKVMSSGAVAGTDLRTITSRHILYEQNGGGVHQIAKSTAQASTPATGSVLLYVRDGTTAGTLKIVALGPGGVETTIVDNIA